MVEFEELTRNNCNKLIEISGVRSQQIDEKLQRVDMLSDELQKTAEKLEQRIRRRCDDERRQTSLSLAELKTAVDAVDSKVSEAFTSMMDMEMRCRDLLRKAEDEMNKCIEVKNEVLQRCEQLETSVASLQFQEVRREAEYLVEKERVIRDSRSPSVDSRRMSGLIHRARGVAALRVRSEGPPSCLEMRTDSTRR